MLAKYRVFSANFRRILAAGAKTDLEQMTAQARVPGIYLYISFSACSVLIDITYLIQNIKSSLSLTHAQNNWAQTSCSLDTGIRGPSR